MRAARHRPNGQRTRREGRPRLTGPAGPPPPVPQEAPPSLPRTPASQASPEKVRRTENRSGLRPPRGAARAPAEIRERGAARAIGVGAGPAGTAARVGGGAAPPGPRGGAPVAAPNARLPGVLREGAAHRELLGAELTQGRGQGAVGDQVVGRGTRDGGGDQVAGPRPLRGRQLGRQREVDQAVVPGPSGDAAGLGIVFTLPFGDQHLDHGVLELLVLLMGDAVLQSGQAFVPLLDDLLGDLIVHARGGGAGPDGVLEGEGAGEAGASTTSRVRWKSCSVSPGKPTMMSVVMAASGMRSRTWSRILRNFLPREERFIRRSTSSEPDCRGMCSWGLTLSVSALDVMSSSVILDGTRVEERYPSR